MLRCLLEDLLLGEQGLATAGIPVIVDGRPILVHGRLTNILADGDGLRQALDWRGASGLKPCVKHYNVFKKDCCNAWLIDGTSLECRLLA